MDSRLTARDYRRLERWNLILEYCLDTNRTVIDVLKAYPLMHKTVVISDVKALEVDGYMTIEKIPNGDNGKYKMRFRSNRAEYNADEFLPITVRNNVNGTVNRSVRNIVNRVTVEALPSYIRRFSSDDRSTEFKEKHDLANQIRRQERASAKVYVGCSFSMMNGADA